MGIFMADEIINLKRACAEAGGNFTLSNALLHCKRDRIEDVTIEQYLSLMACMQKKVA